MLQEAMEGVHPDPKPEKTIFRGWHGKNKMVIAGCAVTVTLEAMDSLR